MKLAYASWTNMQAFASRFVPVKTLFLTAETGRNRVKKRTTKKHNGKKRKGATYVYNRNKNNYKLSI